MSHKIYWFCFKRQLEELYYLLYSEKFISCEAGEFISHFTGKKFRIDEDYTGKIKWNGDEDSFHAVMNHLIAKRFIDDLGLYDHFVIAADANQKKETPETKQLKQKLEILLPAETGYRCKQRLFYRERNKENISKILHQNGTKL